MTCDHDIGQRVLEELVELGVFAESGKFFDPTASSEEELQVLLQLQRQGFVKKIEDKTRNLCRFQLASRAAMLVEAERNMKKQMKHDETINHTPAL